MRRFCTVLGLLAFSIACGGNSSSGEPQVNPDPEAPAVGVADTWFEVSGDANLRVEPATASLFTGRADIVTLNVVSGREAVQEHGRSYSANLFFSQSFDPQPGVYPIKFSYRGEANTLGGSFIGEGMYSHDTEGEAEFMEFGDTVRVRFRFTAYSTSAGDADRKSVTVTGEAVCARGDAL